MGAMCLCWVIKNLQLVRDKGCKVECQFVEVVAQHVNRSMHSLETSEFLKSEISTSVLAYCAQLLILLPFLVNT